jgi:hypothetical protein
MAGVAGARRPLCEPLASVTSRRPVLVVNRTGRPMACYRMGYLTRIHAYTSARQWPEISNRRWKSFISAAIPIALASRLRPPSHPLAVRGIRCRLSERRPRACTFPHCWAGGLPPARPGRTPAARGVASVCAETLHRKPSTPACPWYISNGSTVRRPGQPHLPLDLPPRNHAPYLLRVLCRPAARSSLQHHKRQRHDAIYGACRDHLLVPGDHSRVA